MWTLFTQCYFHTQKKSAYVSYLTNLLQIFTTTTKYETVKINADLRLSYRKNPQFFHNEAGDLELIV